MSRAGQHSLGSSPEAVEGFAGKVCRVHGVDTQVLLRTAACKYPVRDVNIYNFYDISLHLYGHKNLPLSYTKIMLVISCSQNSINRMNDIGYMNPTLDGF